MVLKREEKIKILKMAENTSVADSTHNHEQCEQDPGPANAPKVRLSIFPFRYFHISYPIQKSSLGFISTQDFLNLLNYRTPPPFLSEKIVKQTHLQVSYCQKIK